MTNILYGKNAINFQNLQAGGGATASVVAGSGVADDPNPNVLLNAEYEAELELHVGPAEGEGFNKQAVLDFQDSFPFEAFKQGAAISGLLPTGWEFSEGVTVQDKTTGRTIQKQVSEIPPEARQGLQEALSQPKVKRVMELAEKAMGMLTDEEQNDPEAFKAALQVAASDLD